MRRSFLFGLVPVLAFASAFLTNKPAHAGPKLDLDLDLGTAFQNRLTSRWAVEFGPATALTSAIPLFTSSRSLASTT